MNRRFRIGVFDSGAGGLELMDQLRRLLPAERLYYFADTVNNPYGERPAAEVERFVVEIVEGMLLRRVKLLVIACNTASALFLRLPPEHPLRAKLAAAGVDVIPMAISEAVSELAVLKPRRVLVAATRLTVESGVYQRMAAELVPAAVVETVAAPEWVTRVERPVDDPETERALRRDAVRRALAPYLDAPPDALVLACTHFPQLVSEIREAIGPRCALVNPAIGLAHFVKNYLDVRGLAADAEDRRDGRDAVLFTNGRAEAIEKQLARLGAGSRVVVRQVDIRNDLSGKAVDIVGFGATGQSVLRHLATRGASRIVVRDCRVAAAEDVRRHFPDLAVAVKTGPDYLEGLSEADVVVRSPGAPADLPPFRAARAAGAPILTDIDLFLSRAKGRKVAISGTNGKTTTTILAHRLFAESLGDAARIVGNVGRPALDDLPELTDRSVSALELSSFQLEELSALPVDASVLLNITPDHLDRHGDMAGYIRAKGRIFTLLDARAFAIYNIDCEATVNGLLPQGCRARMAPFSRRRRLSLGAWLEGDDLVFAYPDKRPLIIRGFLNAARFVGHHNIENLMGAGLAAYLLDAPPADIERVIRRFKGVQYRIERFYRLSGATCYDDSKGTNPDATIKAVEALDAPIRLVAGGSNKGYGFEDVAAACRGRVVAAYLFGEISPLFAGSLAELDPPVPATLAADLETATRLAAADAKPGEAVLFSPASASPPGQKYYQRGDRFKAAVAALGPNELDDVGGYLPDPLAERGHAH
ncbi:MAG: UDP-N-acetylmuramoyl-L-alanine--D-glutamate ligase [Myxococcales bacterium]|nr:MAG: UDP-N-acetylmuramoyl-L-alanine--D-glutamate ligase [Myxococcales bacterium]